MAHEKQRPGKDDPFLHNMRWPGISVHSIEFEQLSAPERLYQRSRAFLNSALVLCESAGELGTKLDWPRASACIYCLHLSTELFLKACIYSAKGMQENPNHNIPELRKEYKTLFPGESFVFDTPWRFSAKDLEDLGFGPISDNSIHRNPDQLYKYGMYKKGNVASGLLGFTPGYLFNYMQDLGEKWTRIWQAIRNKKGIAT